MPGFGPPPGPATWYPGRLDAIRGRIGLYDLDLAEGDPRIRALTRWLTSSAVVAAWRIAVGASFCTCVACCDHNSALRPRGAGDE